MIIRSFSWNLIIKPKFCLTKALRPKWKEKRKNSWKSKSWTRKKKGNRKLSWFKLRFQALEVSYIMIPRSFSWNLIIKLKFFLNQGLEAEMKKKEKSIEKPREKLELFLNKSKENLKINPYLNEVLERKEKLGSLKS